MNQTAINHPPCPSCLGTGVVGRQYCACRAGIERQFRNLYPNFDDDRINRLVEMRVGTRRRVTLLRNQDQED